MAETGIGAAVRRKEDNRFLTGRGRYTDDISRPGQVYAYFLRSPHAHATLNGINTDAARNLPGVVAIYTGGDPEADGVGGLICGWVITDKSGEKAKVPPRPLLAKDTVHYVGDHVAVVIAETLAQAKDAAELIEVDYEELAACIGTAKALDPDAPQVHAEAPGNLCFDWEVGDEAATDAAFAKAHHVTKLNLVNNRLIPNAIEPRAAIGEYDPGGDSFTLYVTSQNPHIARIIISAFHNVAPEHKLRVVAPDIGGAFGSKLPIYAEEVVCVWASKKVGRPVKWTADRSESFLADVHGRDHVTEAELALDENGKFLGLRAHTIANMGAYLSTIAPGIPTWLHGLLFAGQYTTSAIYVNVKGVFTHTSPVDLYRGAGRPEATFVVERLVENAAREMGIDPVEIRRRNLIPPDAFPYQTPVVAIYDSGDYAPVLDKALEMADYAGFEARRQQAEHSGKLRGIGFSNYIEACGLAPSKVAGAIGFALGLWESAQVRFNPTGNVTVFTGSHAQGQGHETAFAQIVSDRLGVPIENVEIVHGDTDKVQFSMGTSGSRSAAVGGSAIAKACDKIIAKGKKIAAHALESSEGDVEFEAGAFKVAGTDKSVSIADVAFAAYVPHNYPLEELEPGLDENAFYDPGNFTFPAGCHICEVEIDPETGVVVIVNWVAVDDFGKVINPMIVEGQVHGGVTQGIGQALLEDCVHDQDTGQLLTGSYMDYTMPRADDVPNFKVGFIETPCPHNPLGVKGCGEAGAIAAPAALINAVTGAIGVDHLDMPATPEKVWRAIQKAGKAPAE
ncbi:MAG: xanthine dehydrogenase family protein molybdopterin-binding subunit [Alphaproteobacteria bacterium]|jgi:carbon-monoxide dehydrogenase large subunit